MMSKVSGACTGRTGCNPPAKHPRLEAHAGHELAGSPGGDQRHAAAIARDDVTRRVEAFRLDLQALDRGIDRA